jgi:rhodanese-related sulfurtransferase
MTDFPEVAPAWVRSAFLTRAETALLDVREEAEFARGHPLFASHMALGNIELEACDRIPRRTTPIVLYDAGGELAQRAARTFAALGYIDLALLAGGLAGWTDAGFELFEDVNSYSKAFGELVAERHETPLLPPGEVMDWIARGDDLVILDVRRFEEYQVMSIPGASSVPGAELVLRASVAAPDPSTRIIVNCAGRTRGIIGTQSLIEAGIPNPVGALENGTIGWLLSGQTLEHGQSRQIAKPGGEAARLAREQARSVAYRAGVRGLSSQDLARLEQDGARTLYRFDVRTPGEYADGHPAGFRNAPGGQLVQEIDHFAPVRGGRIVLADSEGARAEMTAAWLAQLGWDVYVLDDPGGLPAETGRWRPAAPPPPVAAGISPGDLVALLPEATILDLAGSKAFRNAHIPGAWFVIRSRLADAAAKLDGAREVVLTSPDGILARFAAAEVSDLARCPVRVLEGGTAAWIAEGRPTASGWDTAISVADDVYKRPYEGVDSSPEAMRAYLDWEGGLVEQLARDGTHGFFTISSNGDSRHRP